MNSETQPNLLKPRWRKVFTDLWNDKGRTGLVVASIAAGVFAIGMIISTYVIMSEDINRSYMAINPPNIEIRSDPFDQDLIEVVESVPGVEEVQGRSLLEIRARKGDENWQNLTMVAASDLTRDINRLVPLEGTQYPEKNEVVVSQDLIHVSGFHPGDEIDIELPDGSQHRVTVVGLVTDQTASQPDMNSPNNVFITSKTLRSFGADDTFNQLYVTVTGDGSDPEFIHQVAVRIEDKVENSQRSVYEIDERLSNEHPMSDIILAVLGILGALGGLITVLSSSLIINTLNALLTQQLRQIGIMKLVGGRRSQILGMYLTLILAYSISALVIAVPLGAIAGYALSWLIATLLGAVLQGFRVIPIAIVVQVLIAILIPLGAGSFPVNSGVKTNVQQAISNYRPPNRASRFKLFSHAPGWFQWISRPILLSFRNTFRKRGRLLLTIFTLTVAGAVFIAVFNVRDSMGNLTNQLMMHFMGDVTVTMHRPYKIDKVERVLRAVQGVKEVEAWGGAVGEVWDEDDDRVSDLTIVAPPQDTRLLNPEFVAGRWLLPGEERAIVMSDTIYNFYPDLQPGDTIVIKLPGRQKEAWEVVGVFRFVNLLGDLLAYGNYDFIVGRTHFPDQAASFRVTAETQDAASLDRLIRHIDDALRERNFMVQNVQSGFLMRESATQAIDILIVFLLIMAILTAFVGSIGLTGTMSINVLERTREIGVMRTIGAVDRVVMQSVIIEGLVIGLITWVLAIGVSFPISTVLLTIIGESILGSSLALNFTPLGILIWLAVVIILSVVASIVPARNAARLTINEVLAYE